MTTARREWTTREVAYLKEHYPTEGAKTVAAALCRDPGAVGAYANSIGVKRRRPPKMEFDFDGIKARCEIDDTDSDSCWLWQGRMSAGIPVGHVQSLHSFSLRRRMWELVNGPTATSELVRMTKCECENCLNPAHMKLITRGKLLRENAGKEDRLVKSARAHRAAVERGHAKATMEVARQIRLMPGTAREAAEKFGLSESSVNSIRRGASWRDYSALGEHRITRQRKAL